MRRHPWVMPGIFWTALAGGVLLKGPLILMFVVLTVGVALIAIDRSASWIWRLKPLAGIGWFSLLVLPWFVAIVAAQRRQLLRRVRSAATCCPRSAAARNRTAHRPAPISSLFWVTFFPGAMLAGLAAPAVWRDRANPAPSSCWPGWCRPGSCSRSS